MEVNKYFSTASDLVIKAADTNFGKFISANVGNVIDSNELFAAVEKDFGSRDFVNFFCDKNGDSEMLAEVRLYLAKSLPGGTLRDMLIKPPSSEKGNCSQNFLIKKINVSNQSSTTPSPLLTKGQPVDWWFVFKLNSGKFPACGGAAQRSCIFGGDTDNNKGPFGQQYVYAGINNPALQKGSVCLGDTLTDPVGATFDQIYNGSYYYVVWNDQFYNDPYIEGCSNSCSAPWGHSKGVVACNNNGDGLVMQVSTPSWPGSGNSLYPRKQTDGNTLGCVKDDNVLVSQHFFALRLNKDDLLKVLQALQNASVVTLPNKQIVNNGGPSDVQAIVRQLGKKIDGKMLMSATLSTGVQLLSKPSQLNVPPWQMVSATLGSVPLRAATWWAYPDEIPTTTQTGFPGCWDSSLKNPPAAVQIATTGRWGQTVFSLTGGESPNANHAKIGISTDPTRPYTIFGDLNQQGALSASNGLKCSSSQNGRGGMFFILNNPVLLTA